MSLLLNYYDIDIYSKDVQLLNDGNWLNDSILSFSLRRILNCTPHEKSSNNLHPIVVDAPVVSYLRIQCEDKEEFEDLRNTLLIPSDSSISAWILLPISNSESFDTLSMHWSLMIVHISPYLPIPAIYHLDSSSGLHGYGGNYDACAGIEEKISMLLDRPVAPTIPISCPQQGNSYDCGVYVALFAEAVISMIHEHIDDTNESNLSCEYMISGAVKHIQPVDVTSCRRRLREEVEAVIHDHHKNGSK